MATALESMESPGNQISIGTSINGRISFAPGTNFDAKLRHNVRDIGASTTYNIKPVTDKSHNYTRFQAPAATTLSMPYVTTNELDYRDPTIYIRKSRNTVPKWFFRSQSDLLVDDREIEELLRQTSKNSSVRRHSIVSDSSKRYDYSQHQRMQDFRRSSARRHQHTTKPIVPTHRIQVHTLNGDSSYVSDPGYKPLVGNTSERLIKNATVKPTQKPLKAALKLENGNLGKQMKPAYRSVRFTDSINVYPKGSPMFLDRGSILRPHDTRISTDESFRLQRRLLQRAGTEVVIPKFDSVKPQNTKGKKEPTSLDAMSLLMARTYEKQAQAKELLKKGL